MPEEIKLIQPAPVVRDENGMFAHPDMPEFDEGDGDKCKAWVAEQALEVTMVSLEYHSDEAVSERYFEAGDRIAVTGSRIGLMVKAGSAWPFTTPTTARSAGGRAEHQDCNAN